MSRLGLFLAEALSLFNCKVELFGELFIAFVGREVESVEAGVTAGKPSLFTHFLNAETLGAITPCNSEYNSYNKLHLRYTIYGTGGTAGMQRNAVGHYFL